MTDTDEHWVDTEFVGVVFRDRCDGDLSRLRTERVVFTECDFSGIDLTESQHIGSAFRNCMFRRTSLAHSAFRHCTLLGSTFTECSMRPITLVEVDLRLAVLAGCDLFTNTAIYMFPRSVVSYALSIVCAQQLKAAYDADPVDGWARYHALCASGGSKLYAETLAAAGLELPYAPGVVERLARELAAQA